MTVFELPTDVASYLRNVRVRNVGTKDAVLRFNSIPYIVRAGDETTVPFEAMCLWLGDPRSGPFARTDKAGGEVRYIPARDDEIVRLRQLYGMHALGGSHQLVTGEDPETGTEIDYPRMQAELADGTRLWTVLEDPEGAQGGTILDPVVARHEKSTNDLIERMQSEINMLKERQAREASGLERQGYQPYEPLTEGDLPRDEAPDPTAPPLPQGKSDNVDFDSTVEEEEPKGWRNKK